MVKLGPDLYTGSDSYSGYQSNGNFTGFSLLHESGTGGAPKYGVVSQLPVVGSIDNPLTDQGISRSKADDARLGYYKSSQSNGITVELGATGKAGLFQYQFPDDADGTNVIVDVSHVLPSFRGQGLGQNYLGGNISVSKTDDGVRYQGSGSYDNVCLSKPIGRHRFKLTFPRVGTAPRSGLFISVAILTSQQLLRRSWVRTQQVTSW